MLRNDEERAHADALTPVVGWHLIDWNSPQGGVTDVQAIGACRRAGASRQCCAGAGGEVGLNLPFTGVGAELAQQIDRGMQQYLKLNADPVKPYKLNSSAAT